MNLLQETREKLKDHEKTPADVKWVQANGHSFSWGEFERLADFEYDEGYGGAEVNQGLMIVGDGWWLERSEYDGSEWWDFRTVPSQPAYFAPRLEDLKDV